jgi:hypothetical protein
VDRRLKAVGSDEIRCQSPAPASYGEGLVAASERWGSHFPGGTPNCLW